MGSESGKGVSHFWALHVSRTICLVPSIPALYALVYLTSCTSQRGSIDEQKVSTSAYQKTMDALVKIRAI